MKKIYKFYGNIIKTEDVDNWDFRKEISDSNNGYRSIDIDNIIYRICNINIDLENEITTFDVKRAFSFSYSIYYPNYNNEIIEELKRLGYSQSSVAGKWHAAHACLSLMSAPSALVYAAAINSKRKACGVWARIIVERCGIRATLPSTISYTVSVLGIATVTASCSSSASHT